MSYLILSIFYFLFSILAWRRLSWAVLLTIAALPTYLIRFTVGPIPMTLLEGMILVIFAVWLLQKLRNSKLKIKNVKFYILHFTFYIPLLLLLLAATISMFVAPDLRAASGVWKAYFVEPILFFLVLRDLLNSKLPSQTASPKSQITNNKFQINHKSQTTNLRFGNWDFLGIWDLEIGISPSQIVAALGLSILIPGLFAIYQKFTGAFIPNPFWAAEETRRVTSFYGYPNAIGLYFAPIVMLALVQAVAYIRKLIIARSSAASSDASVGAARQSHAISEISQKRSIDRFCDIINPLHTLSLPYLRAIPKTLLLTTYYLLLAITGLVAIIFAVSKGALLAIFISLIFLALFWKGYRLIFAGLVVAALIAGMLHPQFRTLTGTPTVEGGGSLEVRIEQWRETWEMLKTRPILGAGLSGYQTRVAPFHEKKYIEIFMYPHNIVLNFWSELGLLGLVVFIWLVAIFYYRGFRVVKSLEIRNCKLEIAAMASMAVILVHGLLDVPYLKNDLAILFWIVYALGMELSKSTPSRPLLTTDKDVV